MIYEHGEIRVDRDFARFGGRSFAIGQINAVEVREDVPPEGSRVWSCVMVAMCLFAWFTAIVFGLLFFLIGCAAAYLAWRLWPSETGPTWRLFVTTSSGQAQAYEAGDPDDVLALRDAIETAMAGR